VNLPALTDWNDMGNTSGSSITIRNSGAVNFDNFTSAIGVSLYVADGLTLTLPALTTFAANRGVNGGHTWNWRATGPAAPLDLPALTTINGPLDHNAFLNIESVAGGTVDLPAVTQILVPAGFNHLARGVRVLADGVDSVVIFPR